MGNRFVIWPVAAAWAVFAALALWLTRGAVSLDTDSALRLVQVRDLLAGQGWFDTVQHRLNTPDGLAMHWSRLVDGPLALLALVSEGFALTAWPLLWLGCVLLLLARIAFVLGGRAAAITVLLLALLCSEIYGGFSPGNIDHHGMQLALMLAALLGLVEQRPVLAAAAVTLSLGVGLESLPYALVAIAAAAVWLKDDAARARIFGLALAGMAPVLLLAVSAYRATPVCDSYSLLHAVLLTMGGCGIAGISQMRRHKLAAFAALAAVLLGLAALMNPVCFAGPYAGMDDRIRMIFLARINEARPVWEFLSFAPSQTIGGYVYAVFALVLCAFAPPGRARNCVIAFAATALLVATFQIRGVNFAILFALPGLAAALTRLALPRNIVWLAAAILLGNSGAFTLAGVLLEGSDKVQNRVTAFHRQEACGGREAMALLQGRPAGRVAGFVDQGPAILAYTNHAAIAGPYHRNQAGILDTYDIFTGTDAPAILKRRGIDYVMTC
ncbi:MAG: hypothetical protein V4601_07185, partial [Pseudomonadota bacterium]